MEQEEFFAQLQENLAKAREAGFIGKRGLTSSHGFLPGIGHVSMPFDCNGQVFIEVQEQGTFIQGWRRMKKEDTGPERIIRCHYCNKNPATRLDHAWPYHNERTTCDSSECKKKSDKAFGIEDGD